MLKSKTFWIVLVLILGLAGGGYYYYTRQTTTAQAAAAEEPAMQTAVARRGELVVLASGTGSLVPASEISLGFDESGTLIELKVGISDQVQAGAVLARLQTQNTPEEIAVSISEAEMDVISAQQALDDLYANAEIARTDAMNNIATYAQEVRDAQYQLENYSMPLYLQGMDAIQALDVTKAALDVASAAFEPYKYYAPGNTTRRALLEDLNVAQSNYDAAVKRLDYEYALQVAQANLDKARQEYEAYKDGPAADELAVVQAELANAEARLSLAKETQSIIELVAPMSGTVMAVDASVGESVGTSTFITLADLDQPLLEVYVDETDLDKVAVGYPAEIVFDALPDQTFNGEVISVSPGLESVSNVQAVKVIVALDKDELGSELTLPVGLNASVDIIAGQAENAVLVPVEALRDLGDGQYAVFVIQDGEPVMRMVEVGLTDVTYAEITFGLDADEVVSTGIVSAGN
ncbi:MAG: efflux RND transporter periplasmic adaptor subunit [Chloroflexota bacterium]